MHIRGESRWIIWLVLLDVCLGFADSMAFTISLFTVFFVAVLEFTVTIPLIDWHCQSFMIVLGRVGNYKKYSLDKDLILVGHCESLMKWRPLQDSNL